MSTIADRAGPDDRPERRDPLRRTGRPSGPLPRRSAPFALVATLLVAVAAGACAPAPSPAPPPPVPVALSPAANATDVAPRAPLTASTEGTFTDVTLTAVGGAPVAGALSPDRRTWSSAAPLAYNSTYAWGGTATAPGRSATPITGSFRTVAPAQQTRASFNIGDGRTVGIAAPIAIQFDAPVADKAAVERALTVTTSVPTEGSWAWLPDQDGGSRVHWRPKEYWKPGTKVDVSAKLMGLPFGGGAWGKDDVTTSFTIGRSQIVKADVNSFRMIVIRDGQQAMDVPASYGKDADPNRITRSGIHVVSEKFTDKRMVSQQYGYDTVEKWAVRMSNNGEFIHANPASAAAQGSSNVTHGCVNLSLGDAQAFYDSAMYGDPVEVTNSGVDLSPRDGDIYDWALPWDQWTTASALT